MRLRGMLLMMVISATLLAAETDNPNGGPVVKAAKHGTRVAVRKTKQGTAEAVKAVRTAAERVTPNPTKPSSGDIANARKAGLVWADHQHWIYYKSGDQYGHTATGEFWTEAQAEGAGYLPADEARAIR